MEMLENFTSGARKVVALARQEAQRFKHAYVGTQHILMGLLEEKEGLAAHLLLEHGATLEAVRFEISQLVADSDSSPPIPGKLPFTARTKQIFDLARKESEKHEHTYIGTEHLLAGVIQEGEGVGAQVLMNLGCIPGPE